MQLNPEMVTSLARTFGLQATSHALAMVGRGLVEVESVVRQHDMVGVIGTVFDGEAPQVRLTFWEADGELFDHDCSIDGTRGCAHVLALLLAVSNGPAEPQPATPAWQSALDAVIAPPSSGAEATEVALFLSVINPATARDRWSYGRRRQRFLGIRPGIRGARGAWIKGHADWRSIESLQAEPRVVDLLRELHGHYQLHGGQHAYYNPEWLPVDELSARGLWPLLVELREAGVELVSAGRAQYPVLLEEEPARTRFAVEHDGGTLHVDAQLLVADESVDPRTIHALGDPAVAIAQIRDPGLATEQTTLHPLAAPVDATLWQLLRANEPVSVDEGGRELFESQYLPRLRTLAPVESPDRTYDVPAPPQLTLELTVHAVEQQVHLTWEWTGEVPGARRDRERELDILARLRVAVGERARLLYPAASVGTSPQPADRILVGPHAVLFVAEVLPALRELDGVTIREGDDVPDYRATQGPPVVSIAAKPGETDWFDLHVEVGVDGEPVEFGDVFRALASGEEIFVLPDGRYFSLDGAEFDRLRSIIEEARTLSDRPLEELRISRYQVDLWDELGTLGIVAAQEQAWLSAAGRLADTDVLEQVPVPAGVDAELRGYQQAGLAWLHFLRSHGLGGILGDDMGLGKTLQAIAMIEVAREEDPGHAPFLVVAPTSVVGNWVRECRRFAPGLSVVAIDATERRRGAPLGEAIGGAHVVVTSYTLLRLEEDDYRAQSWSGLILDEAQMVKNHRSRAYRSAKLIDAPFKLAITGTPLENNLMELWALTALVCPGLLGSDVHFGEHYRGPIEKDGDADRLARLQRRLRPFLLRRRKEDVAAELPPKQEQVLELELHPKHRRRYDLRLQRERQKVLGLLDDMDANRFQVFRSLTLLRQLALDASLVDDGGPAGDGGAVAESVSPPSAKLEALAELLQEAAAEGHRVLVFSQFTRFLGKARDQAAAAGLATAYLDGSTRDREAEIERFRRGDAPAFFISLKAGGFGLNLTEADYVVLLDPWWNPATESQAIDRTHRIGQTRSVMVYRLVAANTIESKVLALSARKAKLFSDVLDGGAAGPSGVLTADEIRSLVS